MKKILGLIALSVFVSGYALAANYSDPIEGTFKSVSGDTLTVEVPSTVSKSPDGSPNGDLDFVVDSNTGYRNFNQLSDLKPGDDIKVEYPDQDNTKLKKMHASIITKVNSGDTTANSNSTVTTVPANQQVVTTTTTSVQ